MDKTELLNRIYDKLFDNVGMSKHHVDLEHDATIDYQWVDPEHNEIGIVIDGAPFTLEIKTGTRYKPK